MNPEERPTCGTDHEANAQPPLPFPNYLPITQFVLRVLGLWIFIEGVGSAVSNGAHAAIEWQYLKSRGYGIEYLNTQPLAWFLGALVYVLVGAYLCLSGRWVMDNVFLPSRTTVEPGDDEEGTQP